MDPSQAEHLYRQMEHDATERLLERSAGLLADGNKGLAVLNSGAALAMLAFFGSLAEKASAPPLLTFKPFGLVALALFLVGAFVASVAFLPHYQQTIFELRQDRPKANTAQRQFWFLTLLSALCFFIGAALAAIGLARAF